jgi:hypothetical protein
VVVVHERGLPHRLKNRQQIQAAKLLGRAEGKDLALHGRRRRGRLHLETKGEDHDREGGLVGAHVVAEAPHLVEEADRWPPALEACRPA